MQRYFPIENYGIVGNLHTAALVSYDRASIDYYCSPDFDSPTVFCRLLDADIGGYFEICPKDTNNPDTFVSATKTYKQLYLPSSNVLLTRFTGEDGIFQVTDYMPILHEQYLLTPKASDVKDIWTGCLIRKIEVIRGRVSLMACCCPSFHYALDTHSLEYSSEFGTCIFRSEKGSLVLRFFSSCLEEISIKSSSCQRSVAQGISLHFTLSENECMYFVLSPVTTNVDKYLFPFDVSVPDIESTLIATLRYWRKWISKCTYTGRWREMVHRSALALKLLTYEPTGAIVASLTFGLPEEIGGSLNWDYRYTWIRDAAFTTYAFIRVGFKDEAIAFMSWIENRIRETVTTEKPLQILYDIRGNVPDPWLHVYPNTTKFLTNIMDEIFLDHLEGYKGSKPVRVGNAASSQLQLDIFGELMDTIYLTDKYCRPISYDFWELIKDKLIPQVLDGHKDKDHGIWEFRGIKRDYTYSKIMNWVAIDRALRLASKRSFPAPFEEWRKARDSIYTEIMTRAFNPARKVFTQSFGSASLDASNLIMPLVLFISPSDPRFVSTLKETLKRPIDGGLVIHHLCFRCQRTDCVGDEVGSTSSKDMIPREGTFNLCSFWLVEALARSASKATGFPDDPVTNSFLDKSVAIFEDMLSYANHLGLYSEELSLNGNALGNFPQAFTHLSLISAAFALNRSLENQNQ